MVMVMYEFIGTKVRFHVKRFDVLKNTRSYDGHMNMYQQIGYMERYQKDTHSYDWRGTMLRDWICMWWINLIWIHPPKENYEMWVEEKKNTCHIIKWHLLKNFRCQGRKFTRVASVTKKKDCHRDIGKKSKNDWWNSGIEKNMRIHISQERD